MSESPNTCQTAAAAEVKSLAVVIPAYKPDFLARALASLEAQTVDDFRIYIGIDASPYDLEAVVAPFAERLPIVCRRFGENLGGSDLVAQWNRCLALTEGEPWIMLFSDDDELEPQCVEQFLSSVRADCSCRGEAYDLYHFNVDVIGESSELLRQTTSYPEVYDACRFLKDKCAARIESFVVEYIFRREAFEGVGGFERFDLAWGSDTATWAKLARRCGIRTVPSARVRWRQSSVNITPQTDGAKLCRKLRADAQFLLWCHTNFSGITWTDTHYYMFRLLFHYAPHLHRADLASCVKAFYCQSAGGRCVYFLLSTFFPLLRLSHSMRRLFRQKL